jgi:uncharacterized protein (TIGR03435 family)
MPRAIRCASLAVLLTAGALAQPTPLSLDVASVRKHELPGPQGSSHIGVTVSGSRVTVVGFSLNNVVLEAYKLKPYQLSGGPNWMDSESYDISAKAERGAELTRDQARMILQSVLADRFQL